MVYSEFPVEQLARLASSPFQIGFARQAMRMLAPSDFGTAALPVNAASVGTRSTLPRRPSGYGKPAGS